MQDIHDGPAHCPADVRPSVAFIQNNRRGLVKQRVSLFSQYSASSSLNSSNDSAVVRIQEEDEEESLSSSRIH